MPVIHLYINSLTHHGLTTDAAREAFVDEAEGKTVYLRRMSYDGVPAVAAFVDDVRVGNVERMAVPLALRALQGAGRRQVAGRIVKAEPFLLTVEVEVERLEADEPAAASLGVWAYSGPVMHESEAELELEYLEDVLTERLRTASPPVEEIVRGVEAYCRLAAHDLSAEGVHTRMELTRMLEHSADERLHRAAERLHEMAQRLGGDHGMIEAGAWMKRHLPTTAEVQLMVARSSYAIRRAAIVAEAERLPQGLWKLWQTDTTMFARALYNLQPSREELRRVSSCLLWLDMTAEEPPTSGRVDVRQMVDYCKSCVHWDDAKPIVAMLYKLLQDGGTREERALVDSVQEDFRRRRHGTTFNAPVTMQSPCIDGPLYEIKDNQEVNLGK